MTMTTKVQGLNVELGGRFDAYEAEAFREAIDPIIEGAAADVVVHLRDVMFIDSTGLSELVRAMKHCRERGVDLVLDEPSNPVAIILELTGLDRAFTIVGARV